MKFTQYSKYVFIFECSFQNYVIGQTRVIKGIVTSGEDNGTLPGVNVLLKGTSIGASTNAEGAYSFTLPPNAGKNATLVFSFIGTVTQEVVIGNQSAISVTLKHEATSLDEVIVSALGFKENAHKRGATASKIDAKDIVRSGETGVINGMSGKAAGVQITKSAGDPGAGSYIQIRGQNSITGSTQPLVIVDGIPMTNKGWELEMNFNILNKKGFNWNVFGNVSRNINRVTNLAGTDIITLGGFRSTSSTVAKVGYAISSLYGGTYLRTETGALNLNANGFPQVAPQFGVIGNPNPKYRGGFGINLSYKKISLNVLFETFQGGDFYNGTRGVLYNFGTHADVGNEVTLTKDLKNYAGKTMAAGSTVRGNIQDFGAGPALLDQSYYTSIGGGFSTLVEQFITDASWTRIREISVGHSISSPKFRQKTKLQSIDVTVTGRNPVLWTKMVGIDPETALNGASNSRGQDYFNSPNTRSLLFSVKINY